ncbi:ANTAR domain-containing protein [Streptomyces sp. NPDC051985]|uniref:ANTAR domain-containing protein n=1 Tax=Streptomyces sp. NPDC051985 TaxID=3155807 RepID=UPI0034192683
MARSGSRVAPSERARRLRLSPRPRNLPAGRVHRPPDRPGHLSAEQAADARVLARNLTLTLLDQATGMVAGQLGATPAEALIRIRAHALRTGSPLLETARAILVRQPTLPASHPPAGGNRS